MYKTFVPDRLKRKTEFAHSRLCDAWKRGKSGMHSLQQQWNQVTKECRSSTKSYRKMCLNSIWECCNEKRKELELHSSSEMCLSPSPSIVDTFDFVLWHCCGCTKIMRWKKFFSPGEIAHSSTNSNNIFSFRMCFLQSARSINTDAFKRCTHSGT